MFRNHHAHKGTTREPRVTRTLEYVGSEGYFPIYYCLDDGKFYYQMELRGRKVLNPVKAQEAINRWTTERYKKLN